MARTLSRRTFLRGAGAAVALPFLDAMVPAFARAQAQARARRFLGWYVPNGMHMAAWTPATTGASYALSPILQPLAPVRSELLVLSNLSNRGCTSAGRNRQRVRIRLGTVFMLLIAPYPRPPSAISAARRNAANELSTSFNSASESKNASVDSAPWFSLIRFSCRPSWQPPVLASYNSNPTSLRPKNHSKASRASFSQRESSVVR